MTPAFCVSVEIQKCWIDAVRLHTCGTQPFITPKLQIVSRFKGSLQVWFLPPLPESSYGVLWWKKIVQRSLPSSFIHDSRDKLSKYSNLIPSNNQNERNEISRWEGSFNNLDLTSLKNRFNVFYPKILLVIFNRLQIITSTPSGSASG